MKASDLLSIVAVLCALATTGLVVRRELGEDGDGSTGDGKPIVGAERLASSAFHSSGPENARITVVEFFDFQCPACRRLAISLDSIVRSRPGWIRIVRHHYPISALHPMANELALAGICLGDTKDFEDFYTHAFESQGRLSSEYGSNSLALMPAGVDTTAIRTCMRSGLTWDKLSRELALADSLGLPGTPSFVVNDRMYFGSRDVAQLLVLLDRADR